MFEDFTAALQSAWSDIVKLPHAFDKKTPGQKPSTPFPAPGKPYTPPKFDDPYKFDWYMQRTKDDWTRSGAWMGRKLYKDYVKGRFNKAQYEAIRAKAKKLTGDESFGDILNAIGNDLGKTAGTVADQVRDKADDILQESSFGKYLIFGGIGLLLILILRR